MCLKSSSARFICRMAFKFKVFYSFHNPLMNRKSFFEERRERFEENISESGFCESHKMISTVYCDIFR